MTILTRWRRQWHPTPVLLPGKSHGRRSLVGCSPWGREESDMTERLHFHFSVSCIGEGNGNPLHCSCLENPRDGGAWWAAVYGVAQSWTQLKWLRSLAAYIQEIVLTKLLSLCCACGQSCLTLCDPMHCQVSLSMEFSRQEYWSGVPFPSPGDLPNSGIKPTSPAIPALAGGIFTTVLSEKLFKIWAKHIPWIHLFNSINVPVRWVVLLSSHFKDEESEAQGSKVFFFSQVTKLGSSWVRIWTKLQALRHSVSQSVQSLSCVQLFVTPWTAAHQASLSITNSQSLPKPMSIKLVMPSNHLILCRPLLLLSSIFPSIRAFSNESALHIRSEKAMASHSSTLAWKIPWMEELSGLQSMGSQRSVHDWATDTHPKSFKHHFPCQHQLLTSVLSHGDHCTVAVVVCFPCLHFLPSILQPLLNTATRNLLLAIKCWS